jgi:hypothetical protein
MPLLLRYCVAKTISYFSVRSSGGDREQQTMEHSTTLATVTGCSTEQYDAWSRFTGTANGNVNRNNNNKTVSQCVASGIK